MNLKTITSSKYDGEYFGDLSLIYNLFPKNIEHIDFESYMYKNLNKSKINKCQVTDVS